MSKYKQYPLKDLIYPFGDDIINALLNFRLPIFPLLTVL